jgi:hypothetical protein
MATASKSAEAATAYFVEHYRPDFALAVMVAVFARSCSPLRDAADAEASADMARDLSALAHLVARIRRRAAVRFKFPLFMEGVTNLERAGIALAAAWAGSGHSKAAVAKGSRGKSASDAETRYRAGEVIGWVKHVTRAPATPALAALAEIAMGLDLPCDDAAAFAARRKRWNKHTPRRLKPKAI